MPKITEKFECLNGAVVLYGSGTSSGKWFYREWDAAAKKYRQKQIADAVDVQEAVSGAIDAAFQIKQEKEGTGPITGAAPLQRQPRLKSFRNTVADNKQKRETVVHAIEQWIIIQNEKAEAGLIDKRTAQAKANVYKNHMLPYLQMKGITWCHQIDLNTFEDYPVYRADSTPLQRQAELKKIKHWCTGYLVKRHLMDPLIVMDKEFIPKVRITQLDMMKNPAINEDDWKVIVDYVRDVWRPEVRLNVNKRYWYWRNLFWHYILFSKNSGMSPEEVLKMKWKQIEIVDEGRVNSNGEREEWEVAYVQTIRSKTKQAREIPVNQARELRRWKEFLIEFCTEHALPMPSRDTYVFGNPVPFGQHSGWRQVDRSSCHSTWVNIRHAVREKLTGHRFSPHPYTLYSMRSTFIEDHLLKGTPVMEVAEMAGHDVRETQKSYARLNLRKKGAQITMPELGKKKTRAKETEQLF